MISASTHGFDPQAIYRYIDGRTYSGQQLVHRKHRMRDPSLFKPTSLHNSSVAKFT